MRWPGGARPVLAAACAAGLAAACLQDDPAVAPAGPSGLALTIHIEADPDVLPEDGRSESRLAVAVSDHTGAPGAHRRLVVQIRSDGRFLDVGRVSTRILHTDARGHATFRYTAPVATDRGVEGGAPDLGRVVRLVVTPASGDHASSLGRSVQIRLVPPGRVIPVFDVTPGFSTTPDAPRAFTPVRFHAARCPADERASDCTRDPSGIVSAHAWRFGDGATADGSDVTHVYDRAGTYVARLTVSDPFGRSSGIIRLVQVQPAVRPTAAFVVSPLGPRVGDPVHLDASASTSAAGRALTAFAWHLGDGTLATGRRVVHRYPAAGVYVVTLTVTDDRGQTGTASGPVTVTEVAPTAAVTFAPALPMAGQEVEFHAETSVATAGRRIVSHQWIFADANGTTTDVRITLEPRVTRVFEAPGEYSVRLLVTDNLGGTASAAVTVPVM